jgi:hypothetical protein
MKNGIVSVAKTSQFHLGHFQHFVQASSCKTSVWKSSHSWPTADESQIENAYGSTSHNKNQLLNPFPILSPHLSGITFRSGGARGVGSHRPPVEALKCFKCRGNQDMLHQTVTTQNWRFHT